MALLKLKDHLSKISERYNDEETAEYIGLVMWLDYFDPGLHAPFWLIMLISVWLLTPRLGFALPTTMLLILSVYVLAILTIYYTILNKLYRKFYKKYYNK